MHGSLQCYLAVSNAGLLKNRIMFFLFKFYIVISFGLVFVGSFFLLSGYFMQLWQEADSPYLPHQHLMIDMYDWMSLTYFEYSCQKTLFQFYISFLIICCVILVKYEICL